MTTPPSDATLQSTTLSRNWLVKMCVFMIALVGFGTWGLVDATVIYPRKGLEDASFKLKSYLQAASNANRLTAVSLKIENPSEELQKLARRESVQQGSKNLGAVKEPLSDVESAKLAWLRALDRTWKLGAAENLVCTAIRPKLGPGGTEVYAGVIGATEAQKEKHTVLFKTRDGVGVTIGPDGKRADLAPDLVLKDLTTYWTAQKKTPSALEFYDLPSQWLFVVIGYGGALYIVGLLLKARGRRYQFDPVQKRLVLPGGQSIVPDDLQEIDKRRWHKFFVTLVTKSGSSHSLDLLRYVPLEAWVLEMEKKAFPEAAEEAAEAEQAPSGDAPGGSPGANGSAPKASRDVGKVSSMTYGGVPDGSFAVLLFDPSNRAPDQDYAAYAQGETLKALGAVLSKEHGWNLWLTAGAGAVGGSSARVGGGPSLGVRSLVEWMDGKGFGYQVDASRFEPGVAARVRAMAGGENATGEPPYAVVVGRITAAAAARLHETMMDPPTRGYAGLLVIKSNPATIERLTQPLEVEGGLEIKGNSCVGAWKAAPAEIEQAGLALAEPVSPD